MPKKLMWINVALPQILKVRFFAKSNGTGKDRLNDVTASVSKIVIESVEDESGACDLLRLDRDGRLVWKTRHQSLKETKWYVEFEYGLKDANWEQFKD